MIRATQRNGLFILSGLAAALTFSVAAYSLLNLSVYQPSTPERLIPGAASQDLVSLLSAVGLALCIVAVRRGREMAWLIWVALLGYLFYAYALYCFERVYNPLYLFYIAILSLVTYSLILFFGRADLTAVRPRAGKKPPRKAAAALFALLVVMFAVLWLSQIIPAMRTRIPPEANTIFVLDLAFFLPLLTIEATLLFRSAMLGDALVIPLLVKVGTLGLSVLIGTLLAPLFGLALNAGEVLIYAVMGLGPLLLGAYFLTTLAVEQNDAYLSPSRARPAA